MQLYFDRLLSADLGIPYTGNHNRHTVMHTDTLKRFSHSDAGKFKPTDLRLVGDELPGWWTITSTVHLASVSETLTA
ncbi:hypothetical protein [Spirosoma spitsbergense]|uniref:hypothetical protein n=1 Tax=Spirosoma spitsbergense TaxID=431554 RepID=UPI00036F79ED|nr:hypothetical protein [Spirosoma spitsbergense]